jgi:NAD-dependent protein deacetylase/lipoamidase
VVILTGAGISAESGLSTFRDQGGIWAKHRVEDVATPEAFLADPRRVLDFYDERRRRLLGSEVAPNAAHRAVAELERRRPDDVLVVTQNVDDLHERAGSRRVIHMHGELLKARCTATGRTVEWRADIAPDARCECCGRAGTLRPHVVWFGEMPLEMERIQRALEACDVFIAIGTSGQVFPAAGFVEVVKRRGRARTVELNLEPTAISSLFDECVHGPATRVVPDYVARL